jgi:hypothetical protein
MHVIRLRGPWELVTVAEHAPSAAVGSQRVQMPCDLAELLGPEFQGQVRLVRPFNRPTNLDPHERVYLVLEGLSASAALVLNGAALIFEAADSTARVEITPHLALHNRLEVSLAVPGETLGEVRLEIG